MRKFQCLLIVLKRSYICYYIIFMTVPLDGEKVLGRKIRMNLFYYYCILFQNTSCCGKFATTALHHLLASFF